MSLFEKYSMITRSASVGFCNHIMRSRQEQKLTALREELASLESDSPGTLHWRKRKETYAFWEYLNGKQIGITKNPSRIYTLARIAYLRLRLDNIRKSDYVSWAKQMEELLQTFDSIGLDLMKIILTKAQYEWASSPQSQNPNRRNDLKFETNNGVKVRSKSEQFIGNLLEALGIPYRYEPELRVGDRIFHPDFVIMTADGKKIILEHLGRMDLREYIHNNIDKLAAYASINLQIGRDIFLSFESDVKSKEKFMPIIHQIMVA